MGVFSLLSILSKAQASNDGKENRMDWAFWNGGGGSGLFSDVEQKLALAASYSNETGSSGSGLHAC